MSERAEPIICENCGKPMSEHGPLADCWPERAEVSATELARLRAVEEAARWHYANSACRGWPQGEVLALALGLNPDAPRDAFARLLDALGVEHDEDDPMARWLDD